MADTTSTSSTHSWHTLSASEASELQHVDMASGLSEEEVKRRQQSYGPNAILTKEGRSVWRILQEQFSDFMIIVLIIAAIVSGLVGEPEDAIAIVVIVLLNAVVGFVQDYRAEKALAAFKKTGSTHRDRSA